ncbi:xanthine dehydrogenase [Streptomyces sp. Ru71]|uniref:XdhC family protein n=1 Tax=Streptomyces sp. Ru71 TaxID=2080746 RepID=UPI000CDCF3A7|nr:XdhC family protein [Streptomyces sp. Ru71]POX48167.1 xanthine dehydrogenase [Streptomyces sp. Ru71]
MIDIAAELEEWCADGRPFALATVVEVTGSAPRPPGTCVAVDATGRVLGSLSGGCVEGAVYNLALDVLETGVPQRVSFGYSDSDAFAVGLSCGGVIDIVVRRVGDEPARQALRVVLDALAEGRPVALATVVESPAEGLGSLRALTPSVAAGDPPAHPDADRTSRALLARGSGGTHRYAADGGCDPTAGELTVLTSVYSSPPRMLVYGAIDFAGAAARVGRFLGYHVTVCDAREVFTTPERFPDADEVVVDWPHRHLRSLADNGALDERTVVCVLTHDAKFDLPLLDLALRLPLGYVGAMGSRRTHAQRLEALRATGLTEHQLARLHSPIGLDIGANTPEETAVSIAAEIIAARTGAGSRPLRTTDGPIHRPAAPLNPGPPAELPNSHD